MATLASQTEHAPAAPGGIAALVEQHGSTMHRYVAGPALRNGRNATRNLADAIHYLCELHAFHPDLIALAAENGMTAAPIRAALAEAADAFAEERGLLTRIVVAAGPIPSTPGQAESEAAALGQRHAIEMLGHSERSGCALGAAAALLVDWRAIRDVLDLAADRFGLPPTRCLLPAPGAVLRLVDGACATTAAARAAHFGAQQYLLQQRGLWDLLESREAARRHG